MPRLKNGFLFAAIILLTATSQTQGQINDLVPPIDGIQREAVSRLKSGPRLNPAFLPLIDDVVNRAYYQPGSDPEQLTVSTCQLNAPLLIASESSDPNRNSVGNNQSTTVKAWVISKGSIPMHVTPELRIQHECPDWDLDCAQGSACESCSKARCSQCAEASKSSAPEGSIDEYCQQLSAMLITTLNGSKDNPQAQQRAIEAALTMVAEKSCQMAHAETDKLQESQHQLIKNILMEHASQGQAAQVAENKSVLEPIYATQYRNSQQLKKLQDTNRSIRQSLFALEQRFASFTMIQRAKLSGAEVKRMMDSLEEEKVREQELEKLQAELQVLDQRILQLQSNPVRRASHLEPIYSPARTLQPMINRYRR